MKHAQLIFGPPGCGKTHTLIGVVQDALDRGYEPETIGFFSYTRKAVQEAADRARNAFNLPRSRLPNFRTLHAMAYHGLGLHRDDIFSSADWMKLGQEVGINLSGLAIQANLALQEQSYLPVGFGVGVEYAQLVERSRMRLVSVREEFNQRRYQHLHYEEADKLARAFDVYRKQLGKYTMVDVLRDALAVARYPKLRVLIVDEAQDLTPLQWALVCDMARDVEEVYVAGDDDQTIHRWAGADPRFLLNHTGPTRVLEQSYRLTRSVFEVSRSIVTTIRDRREKVYRPRPEEGSVHWHRTLDQLMGRADDLRAGSWTFLTRTNKQAKDLSDVLADKGFYHSMQGQACVSAKVRAVATARRALMEGRTLSFGEVRKYYDGMLPKYGKRPMEVLQGADPQRMFGATELQREHYAPSLRVPFRELTGLSERETSQLYAYWRRGADFHGDPRIKVSTIHRTKGGEDDNVVLFLEQNRRIVRAEDPDDRARVFYVGATRARESLHLMEGGPETGFVVG